MSIETVLFTRLKKQVPLISDRVYAGIAPQNVVKPYIVYNKVSPGRDYSHNGFSGLSRPHMQINCYGETYISTKQIAEQVIETLEIWNTDGVRMAFNEGEQDMYEPDTKLYHIPVDFFIHYEN